MGIRYDKHGNKHFTQKQMPKDDMLIWHTIKRFRERFDVKVDEQYVKHLGKRIRHFTKCEFVCRQSNTRSVFLMHCESTDDPMQEDYIAIYNRDKKKVCTVFPVEYLDEWEFDERDARDKLLMEKGRVIGY